MPFPAKLHRHPQLLHGLLLSCALTAVTPLLAQTPPTVITIYENNFEQTNPRQPPINPADDCNRFKLDSAKPGG